MTVATTTRWLFGHWSVSSSYSSSSSGGRQLSFRSPTSICHRSSLQGLPCWLNVETGSATVGGSVESATVGRWVELAMVEVLVVLGRSEGGELW